MNVCFDLFVANNALLSFRRAKVVGLFSSAFKKIIPNKTTPTFQEVGGVTQPLIFCRWHNNFSWYRFNHHRIDRFIAPRYFYLLVCHYFQLK